MVKLRAEEKKLVKDIKIAAGKGDQITVKTLAKSLLRLRQQVGKLTASEALMRGMGTNLTVRPDVKIIPRQKDLHALFYRQNTAGH